MRRYVRRFIQGKTVSRFRVKWSFWGFFESIGRGIVGVCETIATGVTKAYHVVKDAVVKVVEYVGKGLEWLGSKIKEIITSIFSFVTNLFEGIRNKIMNYFNGPTMTKIKTAMACIKKMPGAGVKVTEIVVGLLNKIVDVLAFPAGWIRFVIGLICAWESIIQAVKYLNQGMNEVSKLVKWNLYGKFTGLILHIIVIA